MLRVGYPASISADLLRDFPEGIELIPVSDKMDHDVDIDVWIPDPYATRAMRAWPHLRGVKLVLSMMAGTEWIPGTVGPHVTICNAHGAHNVSTAEWTLAAILAMLKYFPLYLDIQKSGIWKRRFEASAHYAQITGDTRPFHPEVMQEELTGKTVLLVGYGAIGKEIERMLAPFDVKMLRVARSARTAPEVHAVSELERLLPQAEVVVLILPSTAETQGTDRQAPACLDAAGDAAGECRARADCRYRCAGGGAELRPDSRRARCDRSRAAAGGASAVELPQFTHHAAHRRHRRRSLRRARCARRPMSCGAT